MQAWLQYKRKISEIRRVVTRMSSTLEDVLRNAQELLMQTREVVVEGSFISRFTSAKDNRHAGKAASEHLLIVCTTAKMALVGACSNVNTSQGWRKRSHVECWPLEHAKH